MTDSTQRKTTGRRPLLGTASGLIALLAGCASIPGDDPEAELSLDQLHRTAVYVDEAVELSMPEEVSTVTATENADLIVLPGDTAIGGGQAVDWLADGQVLALVGPAAEGTWIGWAQSDPFTQTFDEGGYADGEPDPSLLVATKVDLSVTTYRHSWGGTPRERDLLRALDEDLTAIANRTP